ncbi:hypothetical protein YC2023_107776 [Brassica napus]
MSQKCVFDIIGVVFESLTITDACCHDLVQEGKVCHDTLIKYIADKPHLDMISGMEFSDSFEYLHHSKEVMVQATVFGFKKTRDQTDASCLDKRPD